MTPFYQNGPDFPSKKNLVWLHLELWNKAVVFVRVVKISENRGKLRCITIGIAIHPNRPLVSIQGRPRQLIHRMVFPVLPYKAGAVLDKAMVVGMDLGTGMAVGMAVGMVVDMVVGMDTDTAVGIPVPALALVLDVPALELALVSVSVSAIPVSAAANFLALALDAVLALDSA